MNEIIVPKTVMFSPQVLESVTDECLVRTCQRGAVVIQNSDTVNSQGRIRTALGHTAVISAGAAPPDEAVPAEPITDDTQRNRVSFDAAQLELCRRYEPLILKYAHLSTYMQVQDDVESFLWLVFIEAIFSYDADGTVPFAGYVKSAIHYGQLNYFKHITRAWSHEMTLPMTADDDETECLAMDQFPDESICTSSLLDRHEEQLLRQKLHKACHSLTPAQRDLLRRIYLEQTSLTTLAAMWHTSKQAIQQRHQRALERLRQYMS